MTSILFFWPHLKLRKCVACFCLWLFLLACLCLSHLSSTQEHHREPLTVWKGLGAGHTCCRCVLPLQLLEGHLLKGFRCMDTCDPLLSLKAVILELLVSPGQSLGRPLHPESIKIHNFYFLMEVVTSGFR